MRLRALVLLLGVVLPVESVIQVSASVIERTLLSRKVSA